MFAADQEQWSAQSSARSGPIVRFVWHHQATPNDDGTIGAMVSGSRQVSSTWTVDNKAPVGAGLRDYARITAVVPEDRRPWTSASRADDGALTVECANSSGPPDYGISEASHRACARLAAYALRAYGVPLQRATAANGWRGHMGHNEVVGAFGDGYATACPLHLDIDYILKLAGGDPAIGGDALEEGDPFMTWPNAREEIIGRLDREVIQPIRDLTERERVDDANVAAALGNLTTVLGRMEVTLSDPVSGVWAQVARLAAMVAVLSSAQAGNSDPAVLEAAAEKGAKRALDGLTLKAQP